MLPRWRGAAPIQRAIQAGDALTGVTIMQMDAGLDTGDMLLVGHEPIRDDDSAASLQVRLAALGSRLVVQVLADAAGLLMVMLVETLSSGISLEQHFHILKRGDRHSHFAHLTRCQ